MCLPVVFISKKLVIKKRISIFREAGCHLSLQQTQNKSKSGYMKLTGTYYKNLTYVSVTVDFSVAGIAPLIAPLVIGLKLKNDFLN